MKPSGTERLVTDALVKSLHSLGRGTVKRVNERVGWPPRSIYKYIDRGLRVRELFAILSEARIDPALFFARIFGTVVGRKRFILEAKTLLPRLGHLVPTHSSEILPRQSPEIRGEDDRLSREQLEQLDDLLNLDPCTAIDAASHLASAAAFDGRESDAAALLLRKGSAYRLVLEYEAAHVCLGWALDRLAPARLPDGLLHAALLLGDYSDHGAGIELASESIVGSLHAGDLEMAARGQLLRCRMLRETGRGDEALREIRSAIRLLRMVSEGRRYLGCAHRLLGTLHVERGDVEEASVAVSEASTFGVAQGIPTGKLMLLEARIARSRREAERAVRLYREALGLLAVSALDYPHVVCELASYLLEEGKKTEASEVCKSVTRVLELTRNEAALSVLSRLVKVALSGSISETVLQSTLRRLRLDTFVRPAMTLHKGRAKTTNGPLPLSSS